MRRFVQLSSAIRLSSSRHWLSASVQSSPRLATAPTGQRQISVTSTCAAKERGDRSSPSSRSGVGGNNDKRGLWEIASEKISKASSKSKAKLESIKRAGSPKAQPRHDPRRSSRGDRDRNEPGNQDHREASPSPGGAQGRGSADIQGRAGDHRSMGSVRHDKGSRRFVLDLGDNQLARIDYKPAAGSKDETIELYHTEVPEALRGRGIGKSLARGAFECASREGLKLRVSCDYLKDYVKRFADDKYKKLIGH